MDRVGRTIALSFLGWLPFVAAARCTSLQEPPEKKPSPPVEEPARPAPQLLDGLELESALSYDADPKTAHLLRAAFAGKDYARFWIGAGPEGAEMRWMRLRSGERIFAMRLDASGSIELAGAERGEALAQLELRRALMSFDAFEWKGAERTRECALGALGNLRARFAAPTDKQPCELAFVDAQGHVQDSCREIRWNTSAAKPVPVTLEFWHGETRVWKETVSRVQPVSYTRAAFLPHDQAEGTPTAGSWKVVQTPSPEYVARRFPLPDKSSFEEARKALERLHGEWTPKLAALGLELEARGTLELDTELHPRCLVLRLSKVPERLPEGFEKVAGRSAVGTRLEGFENVGVSALRALSERLPPGVKPGPPYLRWTLEPGGERQVLMLLSWSAGK